MPVELNSDAMHIIFLLYKSTYAAFPYLHLNGGIMVNNIQHKRGVGMGRSLVDRVLWLDVQLYGCHA